MNTLTVPPTPNWYSSGILCCAPDGTVVYGSRRDIVILTPYRESDRPADVRSIYPAHSERVVSVAIDNRHWGNPNKWIASAGEDNLVRLWDASTCTLKAAHNAHENVGSKLAAVNFVDNRVVTVTADGHMVVWCVLSNVARILRKIIVKLYVKCMATCPHKTNMSAVGTSFGYVFVICTKGNGKLLYKVRGQDYDIVSLSFCPSPFNVFHTTEDSQALEIGTSNDVEGSTPTQEPKNEITLPEKHSVAKTPDEDSEKSIQSTDEEVKGLTPSVIQNVDQVTTSSSTPVKKNPWTNLKFPEDFEDVEPVVEESTDEVLKSPKEFLDECKDLRSKLIEISNEEGEFNTPPHLTVSILTEDSVASTGSNKSHPKNNTPNSGATTPHTVVDHRLTTKLMGLLKEPVVDSDTSYEYLNDESLEHNEISQISANLNDIKISSGEILNIEEKSPENCGIKCEIQITHVDNKDITPSGPQSYLSGENLTELKNNQSLGNLSKSNVESTLDYIFLKRFKNESQINSSIASSLNVEVDDLEVTEVDNLVNWKSEEVSKKEDCPDAVIDEDFKKVLTEEDIAKEDLITKPRDLLLASCAKGGCISIWRMGGDGRLQTKLRMSSKLRKPRDRRSKHIQPEWSTVCWATPNIILVTSPSGELLAWDLPPKSDRDSNQPRLIHADHTSPIFCVVVPNTADQEPKSLVAWTFGQDRWLLCTNIFGDRRSVMSYPTFGGYLHAIVASPLDPNRMAIANGDQTLRLFDLSRPHTTNINMNIVYQKIKDKIVVAAWHPVKETCLAFATADGKIGLVDTGSHTKSLTFFHQYFRGFIYVLCWGPPQPVNCGEKYSLYACGEGVAVAYSPQKPQNPPLVIRIEENVTTITWKPDFSVLTFGFKGGCLTFYKPQLDVITKTYEKKSIQYLVWHPEMTAEDDAKSPYSNWLAVATTDFTITVYNCDKLNEDQTIEKVFNINAHDHNICQMAWSPHCNGLLASVSQDDTAKVWNVLTGALVSTFVGHGDYVYCVLWSPLDDDLIFTGGRDCSLRIWRVSENPPCELKRIKNTKVSSTTILPQILAENTEDTNDEKTDLCKKFATLENVDNLAKIKDDVNKKNLQQKSLFTSLSRLHNLKGERSLDDIKRLVEALDAKTLTEKEGLESDKMDGDVAADNKEDVVKVPDTFNFFVSQEGVTDLMESERKIHLQWGHLEPYGHLSLWKGDIKPLIEHATEKKKLNPWLVSMAPMVSIGFWRNTCLMYAEQLKCEDQPLLATSYLLASNLVEEAIQLLSDVRLFREAIALAYSRLPEDDPCIPILYQRWADDSRHTGNFELAAQCYIKLGDWNQAAMLLAKRTDTNTRKLAVELAKRAKNEQLVNSILRGDEEIPSNVETFEETSDDNVPNSN